MKKLMTIFAVVTVFFAVSAANATLIAQWEFEGNANDSIDSYHGAFTDGATTTTDPTRGKVLTLDGDNDWVSVNNHDNFNNTTAFTVACWVKPDFSQSETYARIYVKGSDTNWGLMRWAGGNNISFYIMHPIDGWVGVIGNDDVVTDGQWHHIAGVYDGTNVILYVDGVVDANATTTTVARSTTSAKIGIGASADAPYRPTGGLIDDVRFYNDAQSLTQIQSWSGVPEPATIALLCTGSLAILRKKKYN